MSELSEENENTIKKIKELMSKHNWLYEESDDMRFFRSGQAQKMAILKLLEIIPMFLIPEILDQYCPDDVRHSWEKTLTMRRILNE